MPGTGKNWLNDGIGPLKPAVLTFLSSFCEAVVESSDESWRLRRLLLRFHTCDESIEIFDSSSRNDGLPHGRFLKRTVVAGIKESSLTVGRNVELLGRVLSIHGCDEHTRVWIVCSQGCFF